MTLRCFDQCVHTLFGSKSYFTVHLLPAHLLDLYLAYCCCCCCFQNCTNCCNPNRLCRKSSAFTHLFIILFSSTPSSSHYVVTLDHSCCNTSSQTCWQHNPVINVGKYCANIPAPAISSPEHCKSGRVTISIID